MLILTRRPGESLRIGDEVTVTVLSVKGAYVRTKPGAKTTGLMMHWAVAVRRDGSLRETLSRAARRHVER